MTITDLSWPLAIGNLTTTMLIFHRPRVGVLLLWAIQIPWAAYDVETRQYGFLLLCLAYGLAAALKMKELPE